MDIVKFIKNYTLFRIIPERVLKKSFEKMELEKFPSRTIILDSHYKNDHLYLILEGQVRVVAEDERGVKVDIDNLKAGDCFGEMYLLSGDPQPFYIESITDIELLLIKREVLFDLLENFPGLHYVFYQILLRRLHHISHMKEKEIKEELEVVAVDVVVASKILSYKENILNFLDEINLLLDSESPFGKQLDKLTQKIAEHFNVPLCAIFLEVRGKDFFWLQAINEKIFKGSFQHEFSKNDPIIEHLTQNRQAVSLNHDILSESYPASILNKNLDFNSFYCYPIMDKGKLAAFILLGDGKAITKIKDINQTLELFAGHLAVKIYQVQQVKENRWRKLELISIHRISRKLLSYDNVEDLLFELVKLAADATKAKGCVLRLMDKKAENLKIVAYWGVGKEIAENTTQKIGTGVAGWVIENRRSLIVNDISQDERFENNIKTIAHSLLVVPLINQHEAIGTLTIFDKDTHEQVGSHDFNDDDRTLLESLAVQAAVAIVNTRLKQEAESSIALKQEKFQDKVGLLGESKKVKHFNRKLFEAAQDDDAVLIHGEAGGGKLFTAQSLHNLSPRRDNVFVEYDCANLQPEKWGDEIFGYFHQDNKDSDQGVIEKAEDGTLVLKNIELMPFSSQTKLAYFLKTHKYHKIGASSEKSADVKIVSTTSAELDILVKKRKFDENLFNILTKNLLIIPPLKSRKKDLVTLIDDILEKINQTIHKNITTVSPEAKGLLLNYDWPGNIRELYNVLERGVMLSKTNILEAEHIFFGLPSAEGKKHFNLLRVSWIERLIKSRLFPAIFGIPTVLTFLVIVFFAFYFPARSETNPAVILSWYIGWPFLFLSIFFMGRIWCSICPFSTISRLAQKLFGLEKPAPEFIQTQGHWIMTVFCLVIVWFEEVTDIYSSPLITGILTLFIFSGALIFALIYSRSVWCRYICPWGIFNGVFAQSSLVALRSNRDICLTQCKNYDCYSGGDAAPGCPMFGHPYSQDSNRNCIMCGNCIKNCPHQSILLSVRQLPFELWNNSRPLISISYLCIALALTFLLKNIFDIYYLHPSANRLHEVDTYYVVIYTISYCATLALSYLILIGNNNLLKQGIKVPPKYFIRKLGYSFIPLALAGYLVYFLKVLSQKSGWLLPSIKYYLYQVPLPPNIPSLVSDKFINHLGSLIISVSIFISLVAANEIINKVDKNRIIPFWKKMIPFSLIILIGISYLALI